ncbi:MAG TPA: transposase, partial [Beijerinckiaceae bacterium]|nr:transposase [Beijerinckiaceae bacterium]
MLRHRLMSEDYRRIEVITGAARRRRWMTEEKLRIVDETLRSGESISVVARRHGVAPNLLYRWRRLMTEGGAVAVQADDAVTGNAELRRLEERMRELERQLGRKTLEVENPEGGAGPCTDKKTDVARDVAAQGRFPVKVVAETLGVSRSNLVERLAGGAKPRRRYQKAQDASAPPPICRWYPRWPESRTAFRNPGSKDGDS